MPKRAHSKPAQAPPLARPNDTTTAPVDTNATAPLPAEVEAKTKIRPAGLPTLGAVAAYVSREEWLRAAERGTPADPLIAIVSGIEIDKRGDRSGLVTLHVLDPETPTGIRIERGVARFDGSGPGYQILPGGIDLVSLVQLIDSRIEYTLTQPAAGDGEGE